MYGLSPGVELLVYVTKPIPGEDAASCAATSSDGETVVLPEAGTQRIDVPGRFCDQLQVPGGHVVTMHDVIGDPPREVWFHSMFESSDGRFVNVIEQVTAPDEDRAATMRVLTDDLTVALAQAPGLDFPDPQEWPPAP